MKKTSLIHLLALALLLAFLGGCPSSDEETKSDAGSQSTAQSEEQAPASNGAGAEVAEGAAPAAESQAAPQVPPAIPDVAGIETVVAIVQGMTLPTVEAIAEIEVVAAGAAGEPAPAGDASEAPGAAGAEAAAPSTAAAPASVTNSSGKLELTVYDIPETAKSRNYPPTPQVKDEKEGVAASFGVDVPAGGQSPAPAAGIDVGITPPPAPEQQAAAPESAQKPAESGTVQHDIGLGFVAPQTPSPESSQAQAQAQAEAPQSAKAAEPRQQTAAATPKQAAKPVPAPRPATKKPESVVIGNIPVQPLSADKPVGPEAARVSQQFEDFARYWVKKINSTYVHGPGNIEVINEGGTFLARYTELDPKSVSLLIKEKQYDHTPFVGLMKYNELLYVSTGATPEEALNGKFEVSRRLGITEIFRYSEGKWIE